MSALVRDRNSLPSDVNFSSVTEGDLTSRSSLDHGIAQLDRTFDIAINAAGIVAFGSLTDVPEDVVQQLFAVNSLGVVNLLSVLPRFLNEGSTFASLTGVAADMDVLGMSAYCASKAAAKKALAVGAREFRSKKISILDIRAPHTETGLVTRAIFGEAPAMPQGLEPAFVVARILEALANGERDLPAEAFASYRPDTRTGSFPP